jgi:homoserine O-acetyltransferase
LCSIGSLPVEIAGRNLLWRRSIIEAIRHDPDWKNGDYDRQPQAYSRIGPLIGIMVGNPVRQFEKHPTKAAADAWYDARTKYVYEHRDTNDALYHYDASSDYNPGPDLEKIKAKLLLVEFDDDQINSPEFAVLDREMPRVKNGKYVIVQTGKEGHGEGQDIINANLWVGYFQEFLGSLNK